MLYLLIGAKKCEGSFMRRILDYLLQKELNQFTRNNVWYLVSTLNNKHVIGTKWIFKNKQDENWVIVRNKAILVA